MLRGSHAYEICSYTPMDMASYKLFYEVHFNTMDKIRQFFRTKRIYVGSRPDPF